MPERLLVGSIYYDMIIGNSGSGTKCQPHRCSTSVGGDELGERDEHKRKRVNTRVCAATLQLFCFSLRLLLCNGEGSLQTR
jgi:hypothetical protein